MPPLHLIFVIQTKDLSFLKWFSEKNKKNTHWKQILFPILYVNFWAHLNEWVLGFSQLFVPYYCDLLTIKLMLGSNRFWMTYHKPKVNSRLQKACLQPTEMWWHCAPTNFTRFFLFFLFFNSSSHDWLTKHVRTGLCWDHFLFQSKKFLSWMSPKPETFFKIAVESCTQQQCWSWIFTSCVTNSWRICQPQKGRDWVLFFLMILIKLNHYIIISSMVFLCTQQHT